MKLKKEWSYPYIYVDVPGPFQEDYRMKMLKNNQIEHILSVTGTGRNGESRYGFRLKKGTSMDEYFLKRDITKETIINFSEQLLRVIDELRSHMLSPDGILLFPEFIFVDENNFDFCYLPVDGLDISIKHSFHKITEFFVEKIDYRDTEAIILSYRLHKESMKEFYDLTSIVKNTILEVEKKENEKTEKNKEDVDENNAGQCDINEKKIKTEYPHYETNESIREQKNNYGAFQKVINRIKNGRWGNWDDLITEVSDSKK